MQGENLSSNNYPKKERRPRKREKQFTPCKVVKILLFFHFANADRFALGQDDRVCLGTIYIIPTR